MFANLIQLITGRRPHQDYDLAFVREVNVPAPREARSRRSEVLLAIGWVLIAAKWIAVSWLISRYHVPIHPAWIIAPTILFAGVCTAIYIRRR
jgi:hypothetical protein